MKMANVLAWSIIPLLAAAVAGCGGRGPSMQGQNTVTSGESHQSDAAASAGKVDQSPSIAGFWEFEAEVTQADDDFIVFGDDGSICEYVIRGNTATGVRGSWKQGEDGRLSGTFYDTNVTYTFELDGDRLVMVGGGDSLAMRRSGEKVVPSEVTWIGANLVKYDEPITIIDDDAIRVQVLAKGENIYYPNGDFGYELAIENKTDRDLAVAAGDCSINGEMAFVQFLSSTGHIPAGKKDSNITLAFVKEHVSIASLDQLVNVDGFIETHDWNNGGSYSKDDVTRRPFHIS